MPRPPAADPRYLVEVDRPFEKGLKFRVELDQNVNGRPGPHRVGQAEALGGRRLALWITGASDAGRDARALLEDGLVDPVVWGTRPTIRLRA